MSDKPTIGDVKKWFKEEILPIRTKGKGINLGYRKEIIWDRLRHGNKSDPNGLCGDTLIYVNDEYFQKFRNTGTRDGYEFRAVLWTNAIVFNHVANIMVPRNKQKTCEYSYNELLKKLEHVSGENQFTESELYNLVVFDLYYQSVSDLKTWWLSRSLHRDGSIKIGLAQDL